MEDSLIVLFYYSELFISPSLLLYTSFDNQKPRSNYATTLKLSHLELNNHQAKNEPFCKLLNLFNVFIVAFWFCKIF